MRRTRKRDAYRFDSDEVEDGGTVRVPIMMCDSPRRWPGYASPLTDAQVADMLALHQPGYRTASNLSNIGSLDAARDAARSARDAYVRDLNEAWRMDAKRRRKTESNEEEDPDEEEVEETDSRRTRSAADVRTAAYDGYVKRLTEAWKPSRPVNPTAAFARVGFRPPARDAAEPDNASSAEIMRRHLRTEPDDDLQQRKDKAYADYVARISEAWRSPPGGADPGAATRIERQAEQWRHGR
jgi:hypothetical protein